MFLTLFFILSSSTVVDRIGRLVPSSEPRFAEAVVCHPCILSCTETAPDGFTLGACAPTTPGSDRCSLNATRSINKDNPECSSFAASEVRACNCPATAATASATGSPSASASASSTGSSSTASATATAINPNDATPSATASPTPSATASATGAHTPSATGAPTPSATGAPAPSATAPPKKETPSATGSPAPKAPTPTGTGRTVTPVYYADTAKPVYDNSNCAEKKGCAEEGSGKNTFVSAVEKTEPVHFSGNQLTVESSNEDHTVPAKTSTTVAEHVVKNISN